MTWVLLWLALSAPGYDAAAALPPEQAAPALLAFAESSPTDPLAPEALWDAARLALDALFDPALAVHALDRLRADHAQSRAGTRAAELLAWLETRGARVDPARLARYLRLRDDDGGAIRGFLADAPDFPDAPALRLRLARIEGDGAALEAVTALESDPNWGWRALRVLAARRYDAGDFAGAYDLAQTAGDPAGLARARRMLRFQWSARACAFVVAVWAAGSLAFALRGRRLWPPPGVVRYFAPVALLFLAMAYPMNPLFRPAMWSLAVGCTALLWLAAATPVRRRHPLWRALRDGALMSAFVYTVIVQFGLIGPLAETLRNGAQW